ncbi:MAG TPA: fumarylacetoacetate hydrolase family protein [Ktedonobacteraceae bacterium]|nr:fumarylacetoacetate hydrolase family protein [Ktedonobacteraceae bacterium]
MKLATFRTAAGATHAGIVHDDHVYALNYPTLLELLRDPEGLAQARRVAQEIVTMQSLGGAATSAPLAESAFGRVSMAAHEHISDHPLENVTLLTPIPEPPTARDFYAFEQHVKAARALRNADMIPEWYEIPIFYFTNTSELYGQDAAVPYPVGSNALDFELEIACVIGREGKDIPVEEAADYIAGYTIMNDWSARDVQSRDMKLSLGPGKGKDFATSLGPWLVTPDELAARHSGSGASERYDMTMLTRVNGKEVSRGNFNQIYYSFPQMIAWASRNARLRVGDVLGSGTVGTGCILELGIAVQPWLLRGDVVEMEIDGIGVLRNRIV